MLFLSYDCLAQEPSVTEINDILSGASQVDQYIDLLKGKDVALVVNHTSVIGKTHLVDSLMNLDINVQAIFAPEHGFKGGADAGAQISDGLYLDRIPVYSLYGKTKKPSPEMLKGIDILLFDIQDVGARFYTYLSTLHYTMEAAAEQSIPFIILDRPNPNGHLIDGPVMQVKYMSFVGLHPVPIVYGMTIGEYGQMINGERWLASGVQANLSVIECSGYDHTSTYNLPVAPSPNLPNHRSVLLYPSLCLFEGTTVSVGRGTSNQFQLYGHPELDMDYQFTPVSSYGAKYPKHQDQNCKGIDLTTLDISELKARTQLDFSHILNAHQRLSAQEVEFFNKNN